jgi:hypothetical protein
MTVVTSAETRVQSDALGALLRAWDKFQKTFCSGIEELATAYKACIDGGVEITDEWMRMHHIPPSLGRRLEAIAVGRLLPGLVWRGMPGVIDQLVHLPLGDQEKIIADGVLVKRDGQVVVVAIDDLTGAEAKIVIDRTGRRIVSPEEQELRAKPPVPRRDRRLPAPIVNSDLYATAQADAQRQGISLEAYVAAAVIDRCGWVRKRRTG